MSHSKPYRILLIDDQEAIHEDYRKILGNQLPTTAALGRAAAELFGDDPASCVDWEGFGLSSAMQGQQGFELVQRSIEEGRPYAVAFVDIRMPPGWDGIETVCRIWEVDPEILVVICSAYSDYSWEEMVRKLGRNDRFLILKKPFDNIEVRQCAMALTERWSVSRTDVLTGLLNRRAFQGHFKIEWDRATRKQHPLACVIVDFDFFKRINDTLGHQAGDVVLKQMAELLQDNCRASDYLCRYGGEELCVLLPNADEEVAAAWAERARAAIEATPVMVGDRAVHATASFGVAERAGPGDTREQLIDRADQALIVAKKLGRNRVIRSSAMGDSSDTFDKVRQYVDRFQGITAGQVMISPLATVPANATLGEAAELLRKLRTSALPVVDAHGVLVGVLAEKDVIFVLPSQDAWSLPVERVMQRNFVSFDEHSPVSAICEFLSRAVVRRVFIVRDGCPIGAVSQGSLLRWYGTRMQSENSARSHGTSPATAEGRRARLVHGANAVAQCASQLSTAGAGQASDPLSPVIAEITKVQRMIDDLLGSPSATNIPAILTDSDVIPGAARMHPPAHSG